MSLNILIVDDSAVMRKIILRSLLMAGVPLDETYEASNGRAGLEILAESPVDLMFVDINMPFMSGEEMIDLVRQNPDWGSLPIIVISTEGSETRIAGFREKGAHFIRKPFTPEKVRDVIHGVIGASDGIGN